MANHPVSALPSIQGPSFRQSIQSINELKLFLSFFTHNCYLLEFLTPLMVCNSGVEGWRASTCLFHFCSSTFQISPFCLSIPVFILLTPSVFLKWGNHGEPLLRNYISFCFGFCDIVTDLEALCTQTDSSPQA